HPARPPGRAGLITAGVALGLVAYATAVQVPPLPRLLPPAALAPVLALEPFRIANRYGLFAVMTEERLEIEFQGSRDGGQTWTAYPFRWKPQDPARAPRMFAPFQPRFDWNLWFASLRDWRGDRWVLRVAARLLEGERSVLRLFAADPFAGAPPDRVR